MAGINKTNVARLLDKAKITYDLIPYVVDENNLAATHIAEQLNEDIKQVFKTLVLKGDKNGHFVCVIPGDEEVNLKKAAKVSGNKKADLIAMKELLPTTGYIRGGCTPIGMKKQFKTVIHESILDFDEIIISGGALGVQLFIAPKGLIDCVGAETADIIFKENS